jgi:hypothetical protein
MKAFAGCARLVLLISVFLDLTALGQQVGFLDLTQLDPNPFQHKRFEMGSDCPAVGGGRFGAAVGCPRPTKPLEIELLNFENGEPALGKESAVVVRIRNTGKEAAVLPWSTFPAEIEEPDNAGKFGYDSAILGLTIFLPGNLGISKTALSEVSLFGSVTKAWTQQKVAPGEWVDIKFKVKLDCQYPEATCKSLTGAKELMVEAVWTESKNSVVYEKCSISGGSEAGRYLVSKEVAFGQVAKLVIK